MMTVTPNVNRSDENGLIEKRANNAWSSAPNAKKVGTMMTSVSSGSRRWT